MEINSKSISSFNQVNPMSTNVKGATLKLVNIICNKSRILLLDFLGFIFWIEFFRVPNIWECEDGHRYLL